VPARYVVHREESDEEATASAFVEEILEGEVTFAEIQAMLARLFADPAWDPAFDGMVNLTDGRLELSQEEVATIAERLIHEESASRGRWAFVLRDPLNHGLVRMFASLSDGIPAGMRIFSERREAIERLRSRRGAEG